MWPNEELDRMANFIDNHCQVPTSESLRNTSGILYTFITLYLRSTWPSLGSSLVPKTKVEVFYPRFAGDGVYSQRKEPTCPEFQLGCGRAEPRILMFWVSLKRPRPGKVGSQDPPLCPEPLLSLLSSLGAGSKGTFTFRMPSCFISITWRV